MISVRQALDRVLLDLPRLGGERVALPQARGRVLAAPMRAPHDVPTFANSAMDGYAVRVGDVRAASDVSPVLLSVLETVGAGSVPELPVRPGTATRIMTGAPIPQGADGVVRVEDTVDRDDSVEIRIPVEKGANVRLPGGDLRSGDLVLDTGRVLAPPDLGLLASLGLATVPVIRRPTVAILSTGDELVDVGQPLGPGQIVNSNAYALAAAVEESGGVPIVQSIVRDRPNLIRAAFREALQFDVVLSTGGVSVGRFDYVREILAELGYQERFWKVAQKPGKPLTFGTCGNAAVFGLPGNPVSCLVCFYVYAVPALRTMMSRQDVHLPATIATMAQTLRKANGLTEFIRCRLEGSPDDYRASSTGTQSSAVLSSLSACDGLIVGDPDVAVLEQGQKVRVLLLRPGGASAAAPF